MEQNSNNSQNEFLWTLLANPANDAHLYAYNLQRLVNDFPQSGILQALLAHASEEKNLKQASVYFNPKSLFKLINAPSTFTGVPDERIFIQKGISINGSFQQSEPHFSDVHTEAVIESDIHEEPVSQDTTPTAAEPATLAPVLETGHPDQPGEGTSSIEPIAETLPFTEPETHNQESNTAASAEVPFPPPIADIVAPENITPLVIQPVEEVAEKKDHLIESVIPESEIPHLVEPAVDEGQKVPSGSIVNEHEIPLKHEDLASTIDTEEPVVQPFAEIYEHAADEKDEPIALIDEVDRYEPVPFPADGHHKEETPGETAKPVHEDIEETYDEIVGIENIHYSDQSTYKPASGAQFFSFDKEFGEHADPETAETEQPVSVAAASNGQAEAEQKDVSKYNDEKLPYSFLWWLDKTRKEHAAVYQPYVKPPAANTQPNRRPKKLTDELQQQYFENIFHITTVDDLDKGTPPPKAPYDVKRKEHVIIERFIKEEPQIRPQSSDKLDNENKAKKSSEDRDELVTETLAAIYTDQMLYHKAIASYKKLMLKFPEKSRYFADKIEQLEKKTN